MKPLFGSASQGVIKIDDDATLSEMFSLVQEIAESHLRFVGQDQYGSAVLLEEYLPGRELAIDGILEEGRATWIGVFDKPIPLEGPTFEETIYVTPSREPEAVLEEVFREVQAGCLALGLRSGPVHAEVRLTPNGPALIEIGARAIGGACVRAYSYCLNCDYCRLILQDAIGDTFNVIKHDPVPTGIMMIPTPGAGRLLCVNGLEEARRVDGVRDVLILAKPGDIIRTFPEQGCYLGFILATGSSTCEVVDRLTLSHEMLSFELASFADEPKAGRQCH
jgi:biotin carboxylase